MSVSGLVLLLFTTVRFVQVVCNLEQRYILGALKTVPNHKLNGHQIKTLKGSTLLSCAQLCLAEPRCVSTNFGVSSAENKLVCELNDRSVSLLSNDELGYAEGFIFSLYSETFQTHSDMQEGCKQITCYNGGYCYFNQGKQQFLCKCILPWKGDSYVYYNFTTLGAKGRFGPKSNVLYQGMPLEGILVQDGLQTWNVPVTGQYHLELCGATEGLNTAPWTLTGTQLSVLVGQRGKGGGGGGGTFVVFTVDGSPLAVAGGGGAADIVDGDPGQAGSSGSVNAGGLGLGGKVCVSRGSITDLLGVGGGGGLIADGRCYINSKCNKPCDENDGGKSFNAGGEGGYNKKSRCAGGFGGGGNCGGGVDTLVVVFKSMGEIWIFTPEGEGRLFLMLIGFVFFYGETNATTTMITASPSANASVSPSATGGGVTTTKATPTSSSVVIGLKVILTIIDIAAGFVIDALPDTLKKVVEKIRDDVKKALRKIYPSLDVAKTNYTYNRVILEISIYSEIQKNVTIQQVFEDALMAGLIRGLTPESTRTTFVFPGETNATTIITASPAATANTTYVGGMATTTDAGGMANTTDVGGMATTTDVGGMATTTDVGGMANTTDAGGMATTTDAGGMATTTDVGGMAATTDVGGMATTTDVGGVATTTDVGGMATTTDAGGMATTTDAGGMATTTDAGGMATTTDVGGMATTTDVGGMATTTDAGGMATTTDAGGMATTTDVGGMATTTDVGGMATTTDAGGAVTTTAAGGGAVSATTSSGGGAVSSTTAGGAAGGSATTTTTAPTSSSVVENKVIGAKTALSLEANLDCSGDNLNALSTSIPEDLRKAYESAGFKVANLVATNSTCNSPLKMTLEITFYTGLPKNVTIKQVLEAAVKDGLIRNLTSDNTQFKFVFAGVTIVFKPKSGECKKICCDGGAGGPITVQSQCTPEVKCEGIEVTYKSESGHCPRESKGTCASECKVTEEDFGIQNSPSFAVIILLAVTAVIKTIMVN
ncbi:Glycine rich protein [Desmophyllum pertusum]|uniref:Glycine rich protein n=1 Tax=Desmophyllum pertusum TaxID=174260 RepID=A0A9W9YHV6_9CNID|nr:Glycine rich protein [Desmophyllum pertusum]